MLERRKAKRMELISTITVKPLNDNDVPSQVVIDVIDVSKTGVGFSSKDLLHIGTVYEAHLTIWTKQTIHCFLEIIRIEKTNDGYIYGATFVGMTGMESSRIDIYDIVSSLRK